MPVTTRYAWQEQIASEEPTAEKPNSTRPYRRAKAKAAAVKKEVDSEDEIAGSSSPTPDPPSSPEYDRCDTPKAEPQTPPRYRYDTITPPTISPLSRVETRSSSSENMERGRSPTPSPPPTTGTSTTAAATTTTSTTTPSTTTTAPGQPPYFTPYFLRKDFVPQPPITGNEAWAANRVWNTDSKKWDVIDYDKLAKAEAKNKAKAEKKSAK
ncbi:hypothetical protein EG329_013485 [Mollisiaceae sp. DMI_Dod_QoI]|nr:hypothetical protein EG329_013485 [Helotiales sp. DMI_Dod_QoI]